MLHLSLVLKELPLPKRVIQLCVGIAHFLLHHKELKALREALLQAMPVQLPQGRRRQEIKGGPTVLLQALPS